MTTKDKDILYGKLKERPVWNVDVFDEEPGQFKSFPCYAVSDIESIISEMVAEPEVPKDYEKEYWRAIDLATRMEADATKWRDVAMRHEEELKKLRLIVSTLEFAYGRKLDI